MVWFTEEELRRVAGEGSFHRGREYVDAVGPLAPTACGVRASVRGSDVYEVFLGNDSGALTGECTCPFGADGNFCKHCVAVGLAMLAPSTPDVLSPADLDGYLRSLDAGELVDLLLEQAKRDPALFRRLALRAAGGSGVTVLRRQLEDALRPQGFADTGYADRARDVLDTVRDLVAAGQAAEARPLARLAVERISDALGHVDDSSGAVAGVCRRALSLYARACTAARPNPARLAEWLHRQWVEGPGWPNPDLADFASALGQSGMEAYQALVRSTDSEVPVLPAMREQLAAVSGDVDSLVAVLSESLPKTYPRIVTVLREAGRAAEAVRWLERAVTETGNAELTELLVQSYVDDGQPEDAVELRKAALRESPTRAVYARLRETASGVGEWPALRSWALAVLQADSSELVGALLDDGEIAEAWQVAEVRGCTDRVRLEVARRRADTAPAEVLPAYRELVANCLARTTRDSYREAARLLGELAELSTRCGAEVEFRTYLVLLQKRYNRRPALLEELRRANL